MEETEKKVEIILQKTAEIDYSQLPVLMDLLGNVTTNDFHMDKSQLAKIKLFYPLKNIRKVNAEIIKVKLLKVTGKKNVNLILVKLEPKISYKSARSIMDDHGIKQAGLSDLMCFTNFFQEAPNEDFYVVALREKMFSLGVDLTPVISCFGKKKAGNVELVLRDGIPFLGNTYFLGVTDNPISFE